MWRLASCVAAAAAIPKLLDTPWYKGVGAAVALYIMSGGWKWIRLASKTLGRDLTLIRVFIYLELAIRKWKRSGVVIADIFAEVVAKHPDKKAFVSADTGEALTFKEAEDLANKVANIFHDAGYRKGDIVAIIMENRIEYVPIWIGLSKIGVVSSLINFNLRGDSLKHCLTISNSKAVIFSAELTGLLSDIKDELNMEFFCLNGDNVDMADVKYLGGMLTEASSLTPPRPADLSLSDELLHIYTSGTTGLPKAAVIRGFRALYMCGGVGSGCGMVPEDVIYNALPLYHSNGGLGLAGNVMRIGTTLVVRKKFSASRYFEDCCKNNVTVINYIGETCRYLLATAGNEFDKKHSIRVATGNGLRASIWQEFQDRFNIPLCVEFYGSTEGNANMINTVGKVGAVGFNSVLFPYLFPIKLIKVDKESHEIIRGSNGLAIPVETGEVGMLVGKVRNNVMHKFDGYINKADTNKKVAKDVFSKGDSAFMTGDMLMQDEEGFYYFQDRTGDTFRWKGENVSTNEVEGVISKSLQLNDVCVYGVEVPGIEGRAGMACICDPTRQVDLAQLREAIDVSLPPYARPVFLRQTAEIAKTATFKFQKTKMREAGFNPSECGNDDLYFFSAKEKIFKPIDDSTYQAILNQEIRF